MILTIEDFGPLERLSLIDMSYSRIDTYQTCAAKYFYTYIVQEERVFGPAASLGNIVHGVLQDFVGEELDLPEMLKDVDAQRRRYDPNEEIPPVLMDVGRTLVREFVARHDQDQYDLIAKEMPFQMVIGSGLVTGYIDRVEHRPNNVILITDYKAQPLDAKVLTPNGWTEMGQLSVGDSVVGGDGRPTTVVGVYPQGIIDGFRVSFTDGSSTVCSGDHLWDVSSLGGPYRTIPLSQLHSLRAGNNYRYAVPTVGPVEFTPTPTLPIPPYIMGVILGDGGLTGGALKIHAEDTEIKERVSSLLPSSLRVRHDYEESWRISTSLGQRNVFITALRELGLWGKGSPHKFIPQPYLRSSTEDRLELLRGLMDTDGGCSTRTEYRTVSDRLRDDVIELVRSLGGNPTTSTHAAGYIKDGIKIACRPCHVINVRTHFNPFYLPRKATHWNAPKKDNLRRICSIDPVPSQSMQCIKVDNFDGLYVTDDYIVTHNTGKWEVAKKNVPTNIQLCIYALAVKHHFPEATIRAELYYLRTGKTKGHTFTDDDLQAAEDTVADKITEIVEQRHFQYTENQQKCSYCDFRLNGVCGRFGRRS